MLMLKAKENGSLKINIIYLLSKYMQTINTASQFNCLNTTVHVISVIIYYIFKLQYNFTLYFYIILLMS